MHVVLNRVNTVIVQSFLGANTQTCNVVEWCQVVFLKVHRVFHS